MREGRSGMGLDERRDEAEREEGEIKEIIKKRRGLISFEKRDKERTEWEIGTEGDRGWEMG